MSTLLSGAVRHSPDSANGKNQVSYINQGLEQLVPGSREVPVGSSGLLLLGD